MKAIVFVLRGCSASWLGAYGNEWIATPNLDRFAAEGVVFDRHISNSPDHAAACRTWFATETALQDNPENPSLLKTLRDGGIKTILVRANHPDTDAPDWFYAGWDELFDVRPQEEDRFALDSLIRSLPSLLDRLAKVPDFLLWIDMDSLLPPWKVRQDVFQAYVEDAEEENKYEKEPEAEDDESLLEGESEAEQTEEEDSVDLDAELAPEEPVEYPSDIEEEQEPVTPWADPPTGLFDAKDADAREWLHWSLAAMVTGLDAELGLIFQQLRDRGLDRSASWLLTSDYGYPLGEHGQIGLHRPWLHEELVHLPLIIRLPNADEACRRVGQFTQPSDIAPTLLDLFGQVHGSAISEGVSLLPLIHGETTTVRESAISKLEFGTASELAIRTKEWAFLLPVKVPPGESREPQLFSKPDDRWEVNDLRARNIERCDEFEEQLKKSVDLHDNLPEV
jgi:arylsulfatase A-like enzyme